MTQAPPRHRSFSQVKQLRQCGWQYYLERVLAKPSRPSVPAVAGIAVHSATEVIDHLLHQGHTDTTDIYGRAQAKADEAVEASIAKLSAAGWATETWKKFGRKTTEKPNGEDLTWFREVGIPNSLAAYMAWREQNPDWTLAEIPGFGPAIEVPFNYWVTPGRLVHGFIDRVFTSKAQGGFFPLDIKSGNKPKTDEQLGLYAAALQADESLGWKVTTGYFIYGLKLGTAKITDALDLTHWTQERLGRMYESASLAIDQGIFIPNPGDACWICSVSEHCEYRRSTI